MLGNHDTDVVLRTMTKPVAEMNYHQWLTGIIAAGVAANPKFAEWDADEFMEQVSAITDRVLRDTYDD